MSGVERDIRPFIPELTGVQTGLQHLEDKVAHLAHDGVLQRELALGSYRQHYLLKHPQQVHDAAEAERPTQQIKDQQHNLQAQMRVLETKVPKFAKCGYPHGGTTKAEMEVTNA